MSSDNELVSVTIKAEIDPELARLFDNKIGSTPRNRATTALIRWFVNNDTVSLSEITIIVKPESKEQAHSKNILPRG